MTTSYAPNWIELEGVVNARDVGGLPTSDGRQTKPGVLIRTANLISITEADVARLVDQLGVRRVVDLRTDVEVLKSGPGRLNGADEVVFHHLSLYNDNLQAASRPDAVVPWVEENFVDDRDPQVASYLRYLDRRPDSILAALRAIAEPDGATVVHCAAGKDRTGMIVALALFVVGVPVEVIAADYAHTQSQIQAILDQLARVDLYNHETTRPEDIPPASADKMLAVFEAIDVDHGGVLAWLGTQGWTTDDTERLTARLVG